MTLAPDVLATLGPLAGPADAVAADLVRNEAVRRCFAGDHTLWRDDPTEISDRLGWIPVVQEVLDELPDLRERCERLAGDATHVLIMGMGGSSLFPEVLARTFESSTSRRMQVLDTTDPAAIARIAGQCPAQRTVHVASSKSGSTIETRSHLEWAWVRAGGDAPFAVITDPGSELGGLARDRGFLEVFENRSDIGGRYSALSHFGIVPALLMGVDAEAILRGGLQALDACGPGSSPDANIALALASAMAAGVGVGRDKVTIELAPGVETLGLWLEQLLAESLGKDGTGVVPVVGEPLGSPSVYGDDRLFVVDDASSPAAMALRDAGHPIISLPSGPDATLVGTLVVVAELATALAGAAIGVQPFDQPDVAAAKAATAEVLDDGDVSMPEVPLQQLLSQLQPGDHLALQAFVDPGGADGAALERARIALRDEHRVAVTLGFGPRFLHSTGQMHKGGPRSIVCVQVLGTDADDIEIPGRGFGFGHLKAAQAAGDLRTLQARGIRAGRVPLAELTGVGR